MSGWGLCAQDGCDRPVVTPSGTAVRGPRAAVPHDGSMSASPAASPWPSLRVACGSAEQGYYDVQQVLNTHGVDSAGCPYTGTRNDESESWSPVPG